MSVRTVLTQLLTGDRSHVVVECRHCGTNVSSGTEECPDCGATEFSRYELSE